jgi:hypothetical protein
MQVRWYDGKGYTGTTTDHPTDEAADAAVQDYARRLGWIGITLTPGLIEALDKAADYLGSERRPVRLGYNVRV